MTKIKIENNFVACSNPKNYTIGIFQRVTIKTTSSNAVLSIGNNVGISGCTISCGKSIKIGNNVLIGSGVLITDNDAHAINYKYRSHNARVRHGSIIIDDDDFISARSIILKGIKIGFGSVIGAGSVVTSNVDAYSICAGNPAKKIGDVRDDRYNE